MLKKRNSTGSIEFIRLMIRKFFILLIVWLCSCETFLDVEPPNTKILGELVFEDDATAVAAISGLYLELSSSSNFAGGSPFSIVGLAGLSADELQTYEALEPEFVDFQTNNIIPDNRNILGLWTSLYKVIYQANAILEGLEKSDKVTPGTSSQLRGESLFIRALCHFYLVNCFGDVPLVLTTDYKANAVVSRTPTDIVYNQVEEDLLEAESLLNTVYVSQGKARPNKFAATALLARFYLYTQDWPRAEDKATNIITQSTLYGLPPDLNSVFVAGSKEAIWQLQSQDGSRYANEGYYFSPSIALSYNVLNDTLLSAFEPNDQRKNDWIRTISTGVYLPYKYKKSSNNTGPQTEEYSVVLRLAEQYLIRAEARAQQPGKLNLAIADVNMIRDRAGLAVLQDTDPGISKDSLLIVIEQERRIEFFAEWGHRWFDLKRWGRATGVLDPVKPNWSSYDTLYPLPEEELRRNPNLRPQNNGY